MLAAASSFFAGSNISKQYIVGGSATPGVRGGTATSGPTSPGPSTIPHVPTFRVGPWRVQSASHKTTGKRVSIWDLEKRSAWLERLNPAAKDRAMEVLKTEASALSRLRHPSVLEMVEPLEETRTELTFATEPVLCSLSLTIPGVPGSKSSPVDLDEIEIQKGVLQLCKGLTFLHTSARMIHSNLDPDSVIINSAGDWKIAGLGLTIPLKGPDGNPTRWEFPTYDGRLDAYVQRSLDYMAPEFALDEVLDTASDLYSLGCLLYAVHRKGDPPFKNHGSISSLRDNAGKPPPNMNSLEPDLQVLLRQLITRHPQSRPSPSTLPSQPFFSSLPISTLNFLDRSTFATKSREEKIGFMKGLTNVLGRFSQGLRVRKILPSLVEEMKDINLLPYILPNVFAIAADLTPNQFSAIVLPSLKPLFIIKEPPQNMLTLLDNLDLLQSKTDKASFREHVLPLVYNALESEHGVVQERALKAVPPLCDTIDYAEVQAVLFPRVALVFTKTRVLSVKVATLATFLAMVKTLDQTSLTQKLVPLLSKIRTKEPAVMMGTLAVQEAMGLKVDREAVATLVLPQLWGMSIGPLLNVEQFERFMAVIRKLGDRVAKEHNQFLRDAQRLEDRSANAVNGIASTVAAGAVDFESLVGQADGTTIKADSAADPNWDDDPWGSILAAPAADTPRIRSPAPMSGLPNPASPALASVASQLGVSSQPLSMRTGSSSSLVPPTKRSVVVPAPSPMALASSAQPAFQSFPPSMGSSTPAQAAPMGSFSPANLAMNASAPSTPALGPNYNISLQPMTPSAPAHSPSMIPPAPFFAAQPAMGGLLAPSKPPTSAWGAAPKKPTKDDWADFDPLG